LPPCTPAGSPNGRTMSSGRDLDPAEASPENYSGWADFADCEFIGPLRPAEQAWADHALRADSSAALFQTADSVIRRREAHIAALYRTAALLSLSGDLARSGAASFRAVAESRALAEFMAASPEYCLDCFLLGSRCERHELGDGEPLANPSAAGSSETSPPKRADSGRTGSDSTGSDSTGSRRTGSSSVGSGSGSVESNSNDSGRPDSGSVGSDSGSVDSDSEPVDSNSGSASGSPSSGYRDGQHPGHQPEWRRFGTDEFPSAGG
jgi:hypothetical protein